MADKTTSDSIIFNDIGVQGQLDADWARRVSEHIQDMAERGILDFDVAPRSHHARGSAVDVQAHGVHQINVGTDAEIEVGQPVSSSADGGIVGEMNPGIIGHAVSEVDEDGNVLVRVGTAPDAWSAGDTLVAPDGNTIGYYDSTTGPDEDDGFTEIESDETLAAMLLYMYLQLRKPSEDRSRWSCFDKRTSKKDVQRDWRHVKCEFTITEEELRQAQQELGTMRQIIDMAKSMMPKGTKAKRRLVKI